MSGEKTGSLDIDIARLREQRRAEAAERSALGQQRERAEWEQCRLEELEQEAEAARQAMAEAIRLERGRFETLCAERDGLVRVAGEHGARLAGFVVPPPPPTPAAGDDLDSLRGAIAAVQQSIARYRTAIDRALLAWHQTQAVSASAEAVRALALRMGSGRGLAAGEVITALESSRSRAARARLSVELENCRARALETLSGLERDGLPPSGPVRSAAADVLEAQDRDAAERALKRLENCVAAQRIEREREQVLIAQAERAEVRALVGEQVARVLESMGYAVSSIAETAFVKNGDIYAFREEHPNHVMRVRVDERCVSVTTTPLRIDAAAPASRSAMERSQDQEADRAFDAHCCDRDVGEFRKRAGQRGLGVRFARDRNPGEEPLKHVMIAELGDSLNRKRKAASEGARRAQASRTRTRP